jgi:hypothetical protein
MELDSTFRLYVLWKQNACFGLRRHSRRAVELELV